jgi:hypothetical protein
MGEIDRYVVKRELVTNFRVNETMRSKFKRSAVK